jgi:hypothetical protein
MPLSPVFPSELAVSLAQSKWPQQQFKSYLACFKNSVQYVIYFYAELNNRVPIIVTTNTKYNNKKKHTDNKQTMKI